MTKGFSCEHCGRHESRQAERTCDYCENGMCLDCTEKHDAEDRCPSGKETKRLVVQVDVIDGGYKFHLECGHVIRGTEETVENAHVDCEVCDGS